MTAMKLLTAKVVDGKIDISGDFEEGSTVAVLGSVSDKPQLTLAEEQELADAFEAIRAGEFVDGRQLVADLKARARR